MVSSYGVMSRFSPSLVSIYLRRCRWAMRVSLEFLSSLMFFVCLIFSSVSNVACERAAHRRRVSVQEFDFTVPCEPLIFLF